MYRLRVKLSEPHTVYGYEEEVIIKFFQTEIERRAYLDGLRAAADFAAFNIIDLDE